MKIALPSEIISLRHFEPPLYLLPLLSRILWNSPHGCKRGVDRVEMDGQRVTCVVSLWNRK